MTARTPEPIPVPLERRIYSISPDIRLICTVEDELGGMPELSQRFAHGRWRVSELVALIHIMLQSAGKTVDFMVLGDAMLKDGIDTYLSAARRFLTPFLPKENP